MPQLPSAEQSFSSLPETQASKETSVPANLFDIYENANMMIPQVSDGIKWLIHQEYLESMPLSIEDFVESRFSDDQLKFLAQKTDALHRAYRIAYMTQNGWQKVADAKPETQPPALPDEKPRSTIKETDFHALWIKVVNSLAHNLFYLHQVTDLKMDPQEVGPGENWNHDSEAPDATELAAVIEYVEKTDLSVYRLFLKSVRMAVEGPVGKAILARYRQEFGKGKRTSAVWRDEGYQQKFAELVSRYLEKNDVDSNDSAVKCLLKLYNLEK
jgi:hypothetical protein